MSVSLRGTPKRSTARRLTAKRAAERRFLLAASAATVGIQRGDQPAALLRECLDSHEGNGWQGVTRWKIIFNSI